MKEKTVSSTGLIRPIGIAPRIHDQRENCQSFLNLSFIFWKIKHFFLQALFFVYLQGFGLLLTQQGAPRCVFCT
jgi:hypothetical protein